MLQAAQAQVFHTKDEVLWQSQKWEVVGQDRNFLYCIPARPWMGMPQILAIPQGEARIARDPMERDEETWAAGRSRDEA